MSESVGARSQTRPSMSSLQMRHPRHANQLERGSLKCDNRADISDDVCGGRHSPALAEAMQGGYHRSNPHLQMGDLRQPDIILSPLQMRIPGRKGGALQASLATRLKRLSNKATGLVRCDKIYAQTSIHRAGTGTCPYRLCPDPMTDIGYHNEKDLLDSL